MRFCRGCGTKTAPCHPFACATKYRTKRQPWRFWQSCRFRRLWRFLRSEKLQNESSQNFSNFRPEFRPEFCSEFSPNFSRSFCASFLEEQRPQKNHQKSLQFFNAKFQGKLGETIHYFFWRGGKITLIRTRVWYVGIFGARYEPVQPSALIDLSLQRDPLWKLSKSSSKRLKNFTQISRLLSPKNSTPVFESFFLVFSLLLSLVCLATDCSSSSRSQRSGPGEQQSYSITSNETKKMHLRERCLKEKFSRNDV